MPRLLAGLAALAIGCASAKPTGSESPQPAKAAAAPAAAPSPPASPPDDSLVLEGLGPYRRPVTNASPAAQQWFDQGLNVVFAFNHDEAIRAFAKAASLSPGCAMAWWGIAYANGPHINNPVVESDRAEAAWSALQRAVAASPQASPVEQALIEALTRRYAIPQPADRAPLDGAYADAMRGLLSRFADDPDVLALTAEAMMDVHPWDYWKADGKPQPWTPDIRGMIEAGLEMAPRHPMLNHLYIHILEAGPDVAKATAAANVLRDLQPGLGHMVHMPSHIDVRTGRWEDAVAANQRAIAADAAYRQKRPRQGFYSIYMAHNQHMLAYAAMMSGQSALALKAARDLVAGIPPEFRAGQVAVVDLYYAMPLEVLMRFGRWDEILATPDFEADLPGSRALRHVARAVAFAARGEIGKAKEEQRLFAVGRGQVSKDAIYGNSPVTSVLAVAERLMAGELLFREGQADRGLAELRKAAAAEDLLRYNEPPDWIQPVRHALGAALTTSGRHAEAEKVFREDLRRTPSNGWALYGLARVLELRNQKAESKQVRAEFEQVWQKADVEIKSACFCQQGV